jgi:hypothetical protein
MAFFLFQVALAKVTWLLLEDPWTFVTYLIAHLGGRISWRLAELPSFFLFFKVLHSRDSLCILGICLSLYLSAHLIIHPTIQSPSNCLPVHILALSNIVVEFYIAADFQENPNWNFDVSKDLCLEFVTVTSATCYLSKQVTRIAQIQWENEWISFLPGGVTWISKDGKKVPSLKEIHYVKRAK